MVMRLNAMHQVARESRPTDSQQIRDRSFSTALPSIFVGVDYFM